ncbi:hypothetical protein [Streptomyces sp. NPDC057910]|uniref:hypothetical protein n=1 Tax=Streptomyces sp. NPDC057910 TaxID=3346278 RepID=UPI0036EABC0D
MSDALATAITAAAGLGGALLGAVLPQRFNARERAAEAELADRRRSFEERREAYTAMNRASEGQWHTRCLVIDWSLSVPGWDDRLRSTGTQQKETIHVGQPAR